MPSPNFHPAYDKYSRKLGYPGPAIQLVCDALVAALENRPHRSDRGIKALEICQSVLLLATDWFGAEAEKSLRQWGLDRSEDIGKIIWGLNVLGITRISDDDKTQDFVGLFDLNADRATWKIRWSG